MAFQRFTAPDAYALLWTRDHLAVPAEERAWEKLVVCGHTPHPDPVHDASLVVVDTGACKPHRPGLGRLTAFAWPAATFVSVSYAEAVPPPA